MKIGDKVKYIGQNRSIPPFFGDIGFVTNIFYDDSLCLVKFEYEKIWAECWTKNIEVIE